MPEHALLRSRWKLNWHQHYSLRVGIHHRIHSLVKAMRWLEIRIRTECAPAQYPRGA